MSFIRKRTWSKLFWILGFILFSSFLKPGLGEALAAGEVRAAVYVSEKNSTEETGPAAELMKHTESAEEEAAAEQEHEHSHDALTLPDGRFLIPLGNFRLTGYCSCYSCSEGYGSRTATGGHAVAGRTVAVDPRIIPYGTHLLINGQEYIAEDCGGAIKNRRIDIYFNSHREASNFLQYGDVYVIQNTMAV